MCTVVFSLFFGALAVLVGTGRGEWDLTVLHTNDVHSRIQQLNKYGGTCKEMDASAGQCFGGVARRYTAISNIRDTEDNVILIDGGDQYQGTLWYYYYAGNASSYFMNQLQYDAMSFGNHEFDSSPDGLVDFLRNVNFPVLCSNVDASRESIEGLFSKSTILEVDGHRIGVVGYLTEETRVISYARDLIFFPVLASVRDAVEELQQTGVDIIIALGHAGFLTDVDIATNVPGVDIVVGGHSNTFLYTGEPPSIEEPYSDYPFVVHPAYDSSRTVLVVQDYTYGKYLGYLKVTFDGDGELSDWSGNPILLDNSIEQDPTLLAEVDLWAEPVSQISVEVKGEAGHFLNGDRTICRMEECVLGDLMADAVLEHNLFNLYELDHWDGIAVVLWNAGNIRSSIAQGTVTMGEILMVLPFRGTIDMIELRGDELVAALEHSVQDYNDVDPPGGFLQVSGMKVEYEIFKPPGTRVRHVQIKQCADGSCSTYNDIDYNKHYRILLPTFVSEGGDGFSVIETRRQNVLQTPDLDFEVLSQYFESYSPVTKETDGRIHVMLATSAGGWVSTTLPYVVLIVVCVHSAVLIYLIG